MVQFQGEFGQATIYKYYEAFNANNLEQSEES